MDVEDYEVLSAKDLPSLKACQTPQYNIHYIVLYSHVLI